MAKIVVVASKYHKYHMSNINFKYKYFLIKLLELFALKYSLFIYKKIRGKIVVASKYYKVLQTIISANKFFTIKLNLEKFKQLILSCFKLHSFL